MDITFRAGKESCCNGKKKATPQMNEREKGSRGQEKKISEYECRASRPLYSSLVLKTPALIESLQE